MNARLIILTLFAIRTSDIVSGFFSTALLATVAAGEGVNLQRAHLMVNDDLPWNPNRIEQRFGRFSDAEGR